MPGFTLSRQAHAPVEEVWKLLFDPTRFPEWWAGVASTRPGADGGYTLWPEGWPEFPMPQQLRSDRAAGRVTVSCQVSSIDFVWQLSEADDGGTTISVRVDLPEAEAHRLDGQRELIARSLRTLASLARRDPQAGRERVPDTPAG
jgi:uncharacterized protein YndB with AHSA1/START domain